MPHLLCHHHQPPATANPSAIASPPAIANPPATASATIKIPIILFIIFIVVFVSYASA